MKHISLAQDELDLIKKKIQEVFGTETDLKAYLFGSRATGKNRKNSDIDIAFKSADPDLDKKIYILKDQLEDSKLPYKVDLVNWDKLLKDYLPQIQKQKKKIWDKKDALVYSPWRICPIGQHWVKEHIKEGNSDLTDPHCRWNKTRHDILKFDEIQKISQSEIFKNTPVRATTGNLGMKNHSETIDLLINGWCAYWNYTLMAKEPIHPNLVKALVASESNFILNPKGPKGHTAIGVSQFMPKTVTLLSQRSTELKNHYIEVTRDQMLDLNVNICSSVRWLFRKYEIAPKSKKSWVQVIEGYKGIGKQKGFKSDNIRSTFATYLEMLQK